MAGQDTVTEKVIDQVTETGRRATGRAPAPPSAWRRLWNMITCRRRAAAREISNTQLPLAYKDLVVKGQSLSKEIQIECEDIEGNELLAHSSCPLAHHTAVYKKTRQLL